MACRRLAALALGLGGALAQWGPRPQLPPPPLPPTSVRCTPKGSTQLELAWEAPAARSGAKPPDLYHVRGALATAKLPHISQTAAHSATSALLVDLEPATKYSLSVRGHAGVQGPGADFEWGNFSAPVECITEATPAGAPHSLVRSGGPDGNSITVQWAAPTAAAEGAFAVRWKNPGNASEPTGSKAVTSPSCRIDGLSPGQTYLVQVSAGAASTDWVPFRTMTANRRFTKMYRITENGAKSGGTVDFLSSHNSADANGSAAFLTFAFAGGDDTVKWLSNALSTCRADRLANPKECHHCSSTRSTCRRSRSTASRWKTSRAPLLPLCPFRPRLRCSGAAGGRTT